VEGREGDDNRTRLLENAARDGANREREPREVLSQKLGSASIISGAGTSKTNSTAHLVDSETPRERANHEEEESRIEEEKDENQDEVDLQGRQAGRERSEPG